MNPSIGIVSTLLDLAADIFDYNNAKNAIYTYYFEVYGGSVLPARKNYTSDNTKAFRLFDVLVITDFSMFDWDRERIASWRDNGNQPFLSEEKLRAIPLL